MHLNSRKIETIIIAAIWSIVFILPLCLQYYFSTEDGMKFEMRHLGVFYGDILSIFLLFVLHHYLALPWLYDRKHYWAYSASIVIMVLSISVFMHQWDKGRDLPFERRDREELFHEPDTPPPFGEEPRPEPRRHAGRSGDDPRPERRLNHRSRKHAIIEPPDMARLLLSLLVVGVDMAVCVMLRSRQQHRRLQELEQQNLRQELQYLKHQINPHFFMNTLNNIHVLIDIDQEKAKRSIVELSQLMRYMLYEGNGSYVLLSREVEFITQYISLMTLRYSNKVEIVCQLPQQTGNLQIPPLLLVTFIENAFKHGVSYQQHSFIHIQLEVTDEGQSILFRCINSRHLQTASDESGGIGLDNVRKRLELLYGNDYRLEVDDSQADQFSVTLSLPASGEKSES